jgi:predicted dehydrogenase
MPRTDAPSTARSYAVVGTGSRAEMYLTALLTSHADVGRPVALCDTNEARMAYYDRVVSEVRPGLVLPHYPAADVDALIANERPDVVIVASPDWTHAGYVSRALRAGIDVIVEKPMATDAEGIRSILLARNETAADLAVTFNYRYSPRNSEVRRLIMDGAVGDVTSVHFEWCLDTVHGADYFRRWHRHKAASGGLLVHKSTHHFDLVNWWLDDLPEVVFARGGLRFYGDQNARSRGLGRRPHRSRDAVGPGDPFAIDIVADEKLRGLYADAEHLDGYVRDLDVFGPGITIEDNLSVLVGYRRGAGLSYTLNAHSPWEGYRVAINGTEELEVVERGHLAAATQQAVVDPSAEPDDESGAVAAQQPPGEAGLRPPGSRLLVQRHWETARRITIPEGDGAHGGGDTMLLDDLFRGPGADPLGRAAGCLDGVRSVLVGVSGNASLAEGRAVHLDEFSLPLTADALRTVVDPSR